MTAVCDVYDAITSDRPYKRGWDPAYALRQMAEWSRGHFDLPVFHALVKTLGIYPVGALVRMSSGRLGVVLEQSGSSLTTPASNCFIPPAHPCELRLNYWTCRAALALTASPP